MTKLEELMMYGFPRAVGHTWTELYGVRGNPKAVLIVATERHRDFIDLPKEQMISISNLREKLAGRGCPVVVDHFALSILVGECVRHYKQQIDTLIEEKTNLEAELRNFTK